MTVAAPPFEQSFARALPELAVAWRGATAPDPRPVVVNTALASELGIEPSGELLAGSGVPGFAQAYAGHQFGHAVPRLGDGRALLLGEIGGRDVHLKGSGRTPFARGGDGKAVLGPMLREYLVSEAMHALGIPTTRALAVTVTGESVLRESGPQPGAVLARVAASHLRVGTFQYAAQTGDLGLVRRLVDYAIARHHPEAGDALGLFEAVVEAQASLIAQWMLAGFVHGVMNTDNMTISGETIDYGPCAFMDVFDPATVYSSIDHAGRYAYGNQPHIAQWNLARLGESLLGVIDEDAEAAVEAATAVLNSFPERFNAHWYPALRARLGLAADEPEDKAVVDDLLDLLRVGHVDYTNGLRGAADGSARDLFLDLAAFDAWALRRAARPQREVDPHPLHIPRNHLVEEALVAATAGDLAPFEQLLAVVTDPFGEREGLERYAAPDPAAARYVTFCGT